MSILAPLPKCKLSLSNMMFLGVVSAAEIGQSRSLPWSQRGSKSCFYWRVHHKKANRRGVEMLGEYRRNEDRKRVMRAVQCESVVAGCAGLQYRCIVKLGLDGGVGFCADAIVPPARPECPATCVGKWLCRQRMNHAIGT